MVRAEDPEDMLLILQGFKNKLLFQTHVIHCYPRYVKHVVTQTHVTVFVGFNRLTHGFPPRLIRAKRVPVAFWSLRRTSQAGNAPDGKCSTVSCQNCLGEATHQLHTLFLGVFQLRPKL